MRTADIKPVLTGNILKDSISTAKDQRKPIVEGFMYDHTITMVAAEPGAGKSTIATQIAIELAAGLPVFGMLHTIKPMKVLYAQTERPIIEILERIEVISKIYPIVYDNLYITEEYKMLNMLKEEHVNILAQAIKRDCPDVEVIFIDPIYPMVTGGLSKDEPASAFCKAMSYIQKETGACLFYTHHTVKDQYTNTGNKIERDDPFYGSQWIKAHVTGSYVLTPTEVGVNLVRKKDNYKCLTHLIQLEYNPETELSIVPEGSMPAIEKARKFINMRKIDGKSFTFKEMQSQISCDTRTLRRVLCHTSIKGLLNVVTSSKNKHLYTACP